MAAAELGPDAVVIEVGPGPGTLTAALLPHVGRLIAIELDDRLAPLLQEHFSAWPAFHLIHADALTLPPEQALIQTGGVEPYSLVANLPYYLASALLRTYLEAEAPPRRLVVTVQLDVARRIVASPPQMNLLGVSIQVYAHPFIVRQLPPGAFTPPPKVHSAVLRLDPHPQPLISPPQRQHFFAVVKAGFGQRRKILRNSLASGLAMPPTRVESALVAAGLEPRQRPQELSLEDWLRLSRVLSEDN